MVVCTRHCHDVLENAVFTGFDDLFARSSTTKSFMIISLQVNLKDDSFAMLLGASTLPR